jgi:hypothetical protein
MDSNTEAILKAIEHLDVKTLRETLAYLLKVYVIDKGVSYDRGISAELEDSQAQHTGNLPVTFADLITEIKEQYPMAELKRFSVEDGVVFVTIDGRKFRLSETRSNEPVERHIEQKQSSPPKNVRPGNNGTNPSSRFEKLELD